jgi:phage I-like protein
MSERSVLSLAELAAGRPLVERPAPGKAATAFRMWAHGPNECDGKTVVFSERSAEMLLAEQTARGRLYAFDFDHRSIMPDVSPEAGKAAGWHVLDVREHDGKPELWAASCDWTEEARAGLEADPPEWRYFSPCYGVDPKTREVVSYVGCALTNNPLTHGIPALASAVAAPVSAPGRLALARARCRLVGLRSRS